MVKSGVPDVWWDDYNFFPHMIDYDSMERHDVVAH